VRDGAPSHGLRRSGLVLHPVLTYRCGGSAGIAQIVRTGFPFTCLT
jgi:hypothetical protein